MRTRPLLVAGDPTGRTAWWIGADADHLPARGVVLSAGRWPGAQRASSGLIEVAVEDTFAEALLPGDPLGSRLRIRLPVGRGAGAAQLDVLPGDTPPTTAPAHRELIVVGVISKSPTGADRFGMEEGKAFTDVIRELMQTLGIAARPVPYLESGLGIFVDRSFIEGDHLDWIFLRGDPGRIGETEAAVEELLVERGRSPLIYSNAAWAILSEPELDGYLVLHDIFFWLATGIGLVMLANLLLLAATRRQREIALRQAEGARRSDIFFQFLGEGVVLAAVGIVLGILVGMGLAKLRVAIDPNTMLATEWPWSTIAEGAAILAVGALVAAAGPALLASRHAPAQLIRISGGKVRVGGRGILRHPGRSFLLVTTYALGFASVLAAVATIEGGRKSIREDALALGVDVVAVLNPVQIGPISLLGTAEEGAKPVDLAAIRALTEDLGSDVRAVIPLRMELALVRSDNLATTTTLMATAPPFEGVLRAGLLAGRFFGTSDRISEDPTVPTPVVFDEALARTFHPEDPASLVGQDLQVFRAGRLSPVRVVGVFHDPISLRKHMSAFDGQAKARDVSARRLEFKNVYFPWDDTLEPSGVMVQLLDEGDVEEIVPRIRALLSAREIEPFYHVQRTWVEFVIEIVDRFSSLSHFIWIVDLLMVVVLTATISLLSISERYPEVALRRAEGATRVQVVRPLLLEAVWLGVLSMPVGVGVGLLIVQFGIRPILDWPPYLPPLALWGTPLTVIFAALLAHLVPAWRIARLDPAPVLSEHSDSV